MDKLTSEEIRKAAALQALISSASITEAATKAKISRKTIYGYMHNDPTFLLEYRNAKRLQFREISDRLGDTATMATDTILSIMNDSETPAAVKLQSAKLLLDYFVRYRDVEGLLNQNLLEELEAGEESALNFDMFTTKYPNSL